MAHLLKIRNVTRATPQGLPLLSEVELDLARGEGLVLLGRDGAGKSTLLRILAGLDQPSAGSVLTPAGTRIELVSPETSELRSRWTVQKQLENALGKLSRRERPSEAEGKRRVAETAELLGLEDCLKRQVGTLSRGERARLSIACAWARKPHLLLLDELSRSMEPPMRARLREALHDFKRRSGCGWIFATHDAEEAMALSSPGGRIVALDRGLVRQTGTAEELYLEPANRFVASLFGMNFIEGRLDQRDGDQLFAYADGEAEGLLPLSFLHSVPRVPGAEPGRGSIVLGILPDRIQVAKTPEALGGGGIAEVAQPDEKTLPGWGEILAKSTAAGEGVMSAREEALSAGLAGRALRFVSRVARTEWLGRATRLVLESGNHRWVAWTSISDLRAGDRVWVELDRASLRWFDAQGMRLVVAEADGELPEPLPTLALEEDASTRGLKVEREQYSTEIAREPDRRERGLERSGLE